MCEVNIDIFFNEICDDIITNLQKISIFYIICTLYIEYMLDNNCKYLYIYTRICLFHKYKFRYIM